MTPSYTGADGVLEFATKGGETFTVHPGEILIAIDHTNVAISMIALRD